MAEENINWDELSINETFVNEKSQTIVKRRTPILGKYPSLYIELLQKCNPEIYLSPYNPEKLKIANQIYAQVLSIKDNKETHMLIQLRNRAMNELGIRFSTEVLYDKLCEKCNPQNFMGIHYDETLVDLANDLYNAVLCSADDILALEEIEKIFKESPLALFLQKLKEEKEEAERKIERNTNTVLLFSLSFSIVFLIILIASAN